ncbi:MAG: phage major capsid protein [Ruminococcus sp.]|nr:phage major capsid protein [Ruminococcus sp.]
MGSILSKGNLFPEELIPDFIQQTRGASAIAKLCGSQPILFNGTKEFTFTLDKEVDIVAENGAKGVGGATIGTRTIVPLKIEYGCRISDEFRYASEETQMNYLKAFSEGFARKAAKGLDLMAMHGINPRTATASAIIGTNNFDSAITGSNVITIASGDKPDANIESAIAAVQNAERDATSLIMAPAFRAGLAAQTTNDGAKLYPELAWGNNPGSINGLRTEVTSNLSANSSLDRALVGDFTNAFRWGYAKEIPIEIIEYGNPDNDATLGDLKGHNQIYLRGEMYIGWGILDTAAFAFVKAGE